LSRGCHDSADNDSAVLILLHRSDGTNPYFALWVGDAELLCPWGKRP